MLSESSIQKLRVVQEQILAQPELYDQTTFGDRRDPCGSACCLAGWLVWNESPSLFEKLLREGPDMSDEASRILGTRIRGLFGMGWSWPEPFRKNLEIARTDKARAKVAAARIDHLIATGE